MSFKLDGVAAMQAKIRAFAKRMPDKAAVALFRESEIEMTEAKRRTPVDTGTLRASGFVYPPERNGNRISVLLSFGGAAETYAIIVHEDLEAHHRIGQAKYLESVLSESAGHMLTRIGRRLGVDEI